MRIETGRKMALIGRLFAIAFGFLMACFVSGVIAIFALLFPEMTDISANTINVSNNSDSFTGFVIVAANPA